jgi:hypothetical protein
VQNLLFTSLISKNIKIEIHKPITLLVLYGCETWSLSLREGRRLRVLENRLHRKIFEPKSEEVKGSGK